MTGHAGTVAAWRCSTAGNSVRVAARQLDLGGMPVRVSCPACGFVALREPEADRLRLRRGRRGSTAPRPPRGRSVQGLLGHAGRFRRGGRASHRCAAARAARGDRSRCGAWRVRGRLDGRVRRWSRCGVDTLPLLEAKVVSGDAQAADDVAELAWFAPDALPEPARLAFSTVVDALEAWRARRS